VTRRQRLELQPATCRIRHIVQVPAGTPGATQVLGAWYAPAPSRGIGGDTGWVQATWDRRVGEEGEFTVRLPNTVGGDGVRHRERFRILTDRERYRPGDEWLEIYQDGRLELVGTPVKYQIGRGEIVLTGTDGLPLLARTREFQAGFWADAPRDVLEHYAGAWVAVIADATKRTLTGNALGRPFLPPYTYLSSTAGLGRYWRLDIVVNATDPHPAGQYTIQAVSNVLTMTVADVTLTVTTASTSFLGAFGATPVVAPALPYGRDVTVTVESHDLWRFLYFDGQLVAVTYGPTPRVADNGLTVTATSAVTVSRVLLREHRTWLLDEGAGPFTLPGLPTPGGLIGHYYDGRDEAAKYGPASTLGRGLMLAPTKDEATRRLDATPYFTYASGPQAWQPSTVGAGYFAARWTGAIYLDLANHDITLRLDVGDATARLWIGRTRWSDLLLSVTGVIGAVSFGTVSLRGRLGTVSGWYPLVLTFAQGAPPVGVALTESVDGGPFAPLSPDVLSPYGCYEQQIRNEAHLDQFKQVAETFGYQWTLDPRTLESGAFPGRLIVGRRVGRDTDLVLDEDDGTDLQVQGDATQTADALQADAAGLAGDAGGQVSAEVVLYDQAQAHLFLHEDYESTSDITEPALLAQRISSLLALRGAPWEEVAARPAGFVELADTFPLTGNLQLFRWAPGDGIRLNLPSLGVQDADARQIAGLSRTGRPDGVEPPVASFRPRPRRLRDLLRDLKRAAIAPQRTFQSQLVVVNSDLGTGPGTVAATLPANTGRVLRATLVLASTADPATTWDLVVIGRVAVAAAPGPGRYDITAFISPTAIAERQMAVAVRVNTLAPSQRAWCQIGLELLVQVTG